MANLPIFFLISIVLLLPHPIRSTTTPPACGTGYCGSPELAIEFPFQLTQNYSSVEGDARCGYQGFEVSCNERKQPLIKLPNAGEFVVKNISLEYQYVWIDDPDQCLAKWFLQNADLLKDSPFLWGISTYNRVIFYNCTQPAGKSLVNPQLRVPCLSDDKHSVIVILESDVQRRRYNNSSSCRSIGSALFPVKVVYEESRRIREEILHSDIMLQWFRPSCYCKADQHCGFISDTDHFDVICYANDQGDESPPITSTPGENGWRIASGYIAGALLFLSWALVSVCQERSDQQTTTKKHKESTATRTTKKHGI